MLASMQRADTTPVMETFHRHRSVVPSCPCISRKKGLDADATKGNAKGYSTEQPYPTGIGACVVPTVRLRFSYA